MAWVCLSARAGRWWSRCRGSLDVAGAARIGVLLATVAIWVPRLIVGLVGLKFADCAGMRALAAAAKQFRQAGVAWCCGCLT